MAGIEFFRTFLRRRKHVPIEGDINLAHWSNASDNHLFGDLQTVLIGGPGTTRGHFSSDRVGEDIVIYTDRTGARQELYVFQSPYVYKRCEALEKARSSGLFDLFDDELKDVRGAHPFSAADKIRPIRHGICIGGEQSYVFMYIEFFLKVRRCTSPGLDDVDHLHNHAQFIKERFDDLKRRNTNAIEEFVDLRKTGAAMEPGGFLSAGFRTLETPDDLKRSLQQAAGNIPIRTFPAAAGSIIARAEVDDITSKKNLEWLTTALVQSQDKRPGSCGLQVSSGDRTYARVKEDGGKWKRIKESVRVETVTLSEDREGLEVMGLKLTDSNGEMAAHAWMSSCEGGSTLLRCREVNQHSAEIRDGWGDDDKQERKDVVVLELSHGLHACQIASGDSFFLGISRFGYHCVHVLVSGKKLWGQQVSGPQEGVPTTGDAEVQKPQCRLPSALSDGGLIGREQDIRRIHEGLMAMGCVLLYAGPGNDRSAVALSAGHRLWREGRVAGGAFLVDLQDTLNAGEYPDVPLGTPEAEVHSTQLAQRVVARLTNEVLGVTGLKDAMSQWQKVKEYFQKQAQQGRNTLILIENGQDTQSKMCPQLSKDFEGLVKYMRDNLSRLKLLITSRCYIYLGQTTHQSLEPLGPQRPQRRQSQDTPLQPKPVPVLRKKKTISRKRKTYAGFANTTPAATVREVGPRLARDGPGKSTAVLHRPPSFKRPAGARHVAQKRYKDGMDDAEPMDIELEDAQLLPSDQSSHTGQGDLQDMMHELSGKAPESADSDPSTQEVAQPQRPEAVSLLSNWKPSDSFIKSAVDSTSLEAKLSNELRDRRGKQIVLLHGQSGVGKTSLALSVAKEFHSDQVFPDGVYWLECGMGEGEDRVHTVIGKAQQALLSQLRLSSSDKLPDEQIAEHFQSSIPGHLPQRRPKDCLLVLDDVWDSEVVSAFLLPGVKLLVTSQHGSLLPPDRCSRIKMELPNQEKALDILFGHAQVPRHPSLEDWGLKLVECVGGHPLALACLGTALNGNSNVPAWKRVLRDHQYIMDNPDNLPGFGLDKVKRSVFSSIQLSVEALSYEEQAMLRHIVSFQLPVPRIVVETAWEGEGSASILIDRLVTRSHVDLQNKNFIWGELSILYVHELRTKWLRDTPTASAARDPVSQQLYEVFGLGGEWSRLDTIAQSLINSLVPLLEHHDTHAVAEQAFREILQTKQQESCPVQQPTLEALTALLRDSSPEVQQLAAQVMVAFAEPACVRHIVSAGALLPLLQLMGMPSIEHGIASAAEMAFLLIVLSSEDGEHVGTVTVAVSELANQLEPLLPTVRQEAILSAISYIAAVAGPHYAPAVAPAVPQIVRVLCEGRGRIPTAAAQTLAAVAYATGALPAAATSDALDALTQLLRQPELEGQQAAANAICHLTIEAEQQQLAERLGAPSALVKMLHLTHPGDQDAAALQAQVAAAGAITMLGEHISDSIVQEGALAALVKLIACPTRGPVANLALAELILRSGTPAAIHREQALQDLVGLLREGTEAEQKAAAETFYLIGRAGGAQELGSNLGAAEGLLPLLASQSWETQEMAALALGHMSAYAASLQGTVICDLAPLLKSPFLEVQYAAAWALNDWMQLPNGRAIAREHDVLAALEHMLGCMPIGSARSEALFLLLDLSKDPEIGDRSILLPLLKILSAPQEQEQIWAADAIAAVARLKDLEAAAEVESIMQRLVHLLGQPAAEVREAAALALGRLAVTADQQKIAADLGALDRLVKLLAPLPSQGSSTAPCRPQAVAAWVLGVLAKHVSVRIVEAQAVPALLSLLQPMSAAAPATGMSASALSCLATQVSDSLVQAGALTALMRLLHAPAFPPEVPAAVLAILLCAGNEAADARRVTLEALVERLKSPSELVQAAAAHILRVVAAQSALCAFVRDAGAIEALVPLLAPPSAEVQREAALALWNLTEDAQGAARAGAAGAIGALKQVLADVAPGALQDAAAGALSSVSRDPKNDQLLTEAGVAPVLVKLLPSASVQAQQSAIYVLWDLAMDPASEEDTRSAGVVPALVALLHSAPCSVQYTAAGALLQYVQLFPANQALAGEHGALKALACHLGQPPCPEQKPALQLLGVLLTAHYSKEDAADCIVPLIQQLKVGPPTSKLLAADNLARICRGSLEMNELAEEAGAIPVLLSMFNSQDKAEQEAALAALCNLTSTSSNRLAAAPALPQLVELLRAEAPQIICDASVLLGNIIFEDEHCQAEAQEAGAISLLEENLRSGNQAVGLETAWAWAAWADGQQISLAEAALVGAMATAPLLRLLQMALPPEEPYTCLYPDEIACVIRVLAKLVAHLPDTDLQAEAARALGNAAQYACTLTILALRDSALPQLRLLAHSGAAAVQGQAAAACLAIAEAASQQAANPEESEGVESMDIEEAEPALPAAVEHKAEPGLEDF